VVRCLRGYLSGARCRLAYGRTDATATPFSCFSKIQIGFAFLVPAHLGSPGKRAVKRVCVCVCVCYFTIQIKFSWRLRSRLNRRHCLAVNGAVYLLQAAAENSVVFRWDLKEASEEADRRSGSREFHTGGQLC